MPFICTYFGLKLWLRLIQIHIWDCFPSSSTPPSEVAVVFNWNVSRHSVLGQVINLELILDLLLYT